MTEAAPGAAAITRGGAAVVGLASLVSALSGYVVLVLSARTLDQQQNADFLVFWALLFGVFGVLGGVQQEATRTVRSAELDRTTGTTPVRVLPTGLLVGAAAAVLVAVTAPLWAEAVLGPSPGVLVVILSVAALVYSGHLSMVGVLSGRRRWHASSVLIAAEALGRLVLVGLAAWWGRSTGGLELASGAAAAAWLVGLLLSRTARGATRATGDSDRRTFLVRTGHAVVAAASSAALVVGFPVLLRLTSTEAQWATAAPLLLAISLTRAPLLMPLNAYQGVAITHFLGERARGARALLRPAGAVLAVAVLGAVAAFAVGPALMAAFFGPSYRVDGALLAGLTLAAASLALLTLTGSAVLALGRHRAYATGWVVSTAVSAGLLLTDLPIADRAVLALCVGPLVGIAIHLAVVRTATGDDVLPPSTP